MQRQQSHSDALLTVPCVCVCTHPHRQRMRDSKLRHVLGPEGLEMRAETCAQSAQQTTATRGCQLRFERHDSKDATPRAHASAVQHSQIFPPRYIFEVLPSNSASTISNGVTGYDTGSSNSRSNSYLIISCTYQHLPVHLSSERHTAETRAEVSPTPTRRPWNLELRSQPSCNLNSQPNWMRPASLLPRLPPLIALHPLTSCQACLAR